MLIVFSHPENVLNEAGKVNSIMDHDASVLYHLRKPEWKESELRNLLEAIDPLHYERIVLHHNHHLCPEFKLKGAHLTESQRRENQFQPGIVSTSFHSVAEASDFREEYGYFFCSPVFPSISKIGYSCDENWNIRQQNNDFRQRAVALGGIESSRKKELDELGFRNYAVLGAVWYAMEPVEAFKRLADILT